MSTFLERHNIAVPEPKIEVHDDAPPILRHAVYTIAQQAGVDWGTLWELVRQRVAVPSYRGDVTMDELVAVGLRDCEWYEVYDIAEAIYATTARHHEIAGVYQRLLNSTFRKLGVGWWMNNGLIERRGAKPFEETVHMALDALQGAEMTTSADELAEALHDLSVRPKPDISGAIQHAGAALECTMREICGDPKPTLGQLLKDHPGKIPTPLDAAVEKIWGYSSEMGRHLREGRTPAVEEALLAVQTSAAVTTYLLSKWQKS
jgi:hypothetical protein